MRAQITLIILLASLCCFAATANAEELELESFADAPAAVRDELRSALYVKSQVLSQEIWSPRPAEDARRRLEKLSGRRPGEAHVHRHLGKLLAELGNQREAAEALQRAEKLADDELWPLVDLARYNERRGNWSGQLSTLKRLAAKRQARLEMPGERERLARLLRNVAEVIESHQIEEDSLRYRRQAAELFPERYDAGTQVIRWLVDQGREEEALGQFEWARRLRPEDRSRLLSQQIELLFRLGRPHEARELLRRDVTADDGLRSVHEWETYVHLLRNRGELETELRRARAAVRADARPGVNLAHAVQLLLATGNRDDVVELLERSLTETSDLNDEDRLLLAALSLRAGQAQQTVRLLTQAAISNRGTLRDDAQIRLALLLAENRGPAQPSALQALLDPARLDPGPSVLGGALSLLLGGPPSPAVARELRRRDNRHVQATQAAALVESIALRRPNWEELPALERRLISTYRAFGAHRTALDASRRFLKRHPTHDAFIDVGLDAAAMMRATGSSPMPLLRQLLQKAVSIHDDDAHRRVLSAVQRELNRDRRYGEMISVYWAAIENRPDDVRLYHDLLHYMNTHNRSDEQQEVYRRAMSQFRGRDGWAARYGRYLLQQRGAEAQRELTRRLLRELSPTVLSRYLREAVRSTTQRSADAAAVNAFFLEIYHEALRRHPGELGLARRLLSFYRSHQRQYQAERRALLIRYAPYDSSIRAELYQILAQQGELEAALESLNENESIAAKALAADYLLRRARHDEAREALVALTAAQPGHRASQLRLAELESSLGDRTRARELYGELLSRWPVDQELLTRAGELALEDDDLAEARRLWGRIHEASSGSAAAWLRAATLFWDYFLFEDAARTLVTAREAMGDEDLYAFQLSAVHESAGNREPAVREYIRVLAGAARRSDRWPPGTFIPRQPTDSGVHPSGDAYARGGSQGPQIDAELMHCMRRLLELARRDEDRDIVEDVIRDMMSNAPDDPGLVHFRADLLQATDRWEQSYELLAESALRLSSMSLQERAIRQLNSAGQEREATAILVRLAQNRPLDLTPTFRLTDELVRRGHIASAARTLRELSQRLATDETRRRDREAVELRLARMLFANQRYDESLEAGERALALAEESRAVALRVELARWLLRLERHEEAATMVAPVLSEAPDTASALTVYATARERLALESGQQRQEIIQSLIRTFEEAITATRDRGDDRQRRIQRVRNLRETLIGHLRRLEAHRAVLDQRVALLNAELEDRDLLRGAHRFAATHDLLANLVGRYERDAERSPRDHRLPLVLARFAAAERDFPAAIASMERTLQIAPERMDLREELISYVLRSINESLEHGGWLEAARQYGEVAQLARANGGDGAQWTAAEARMYGRAGAWDEMDEAVRRLLAVEPATPARHLEAAELYEHTGRWQKAWEMTRAYLDNWTEASDLNLRLASRYSSNIALSKCAETALRSGHWREAERALTNLEQEWNTRAQQPNASSRYAYRRLSQLARSARTDRIAYGLRTFGVDRDIRDYVALLPAELRAADNLSGHQARRGRRIHVASLARKAGASQAELTLLSGLLPRLHDVDRENILQAIINRTREIGAAKQLRELAEGEELGVTRHDSLLLEAATALGDREAEEQLLSKLLSQQRDTHGGPRFDSQNPMRERLLELRWHAGEKARHDLPKLARPGENESGQIINFLLEKGDFEGARRALEHFGEAEESKNGSLWLNTARARILLRRAENGPPPEEHEPFTRALDLRTIGAQADRPAKRHQALRGESWARLAQPYGEALARSAEKRPPGRRHLEHASIELDPRSARAQAELGRQALTRSQPELAATHYRLARQLEPNSATIRDGLARALLAAEQRDDALALWDEAYEACHHERCVIQLTNSMVESGLSEEATERATRYLRAHWRSGSVSVNALRTLTRHHGERGRDRGGPVDQLLWQLWQLDRSRTDLLRAAVGLEPGPAILHGRALGRYLRQGLRVNGPDASERLDWINAYVRYLVEFNEHQALVELLERFTAEREAAGQLMPSGLRLQLARGLIGLGRQEPAFELLEELIDLDQRATIELLHELDLEREAQELLYTWANQRLDDGDENRTTYLSAIRALLELERDEEAIILVHRAITARANDAETLQSLAELLGEHQRPAEALRLRRILYQMNRSNAENLLAMAHLEIDVGDLARGRQRALSLLARWAVPQVIEEGATDLLVELSIDESEQRQQIIAALSTALEEHALEEDRSLCLARVLFESGNTRAARAVLERSIREAASPWRSLQLLASWEARAAGDDPDSEHLVNAERLLESALVHAGGAVEIRRQLFLVRRRQNDHQSALHIIGVNQDRPSGTAMLRDLEDAEAIALASEIADSASRIDFWAAADAYTSEALRRIDDEEDPERAQAERARLHVIRTHIATRHAARRGRPWIRRNP